MQFSLQERDNLFLNVDVIKGVSATQFVFEWRHLFNCVADIEDQMGSKIEILDVLDEYAIELTRKIWKVFFK